MAGKRKTSTYWLHRPSTAARRYLQEQQHADDYKEGLARKAAEKEAASPQKENKSNSEAPM